MERTLIDAKSWRLVWFGNCEFNFWRWNNRHKANADLYRRVLNIAWLSIQWGRGK
jgi:hypothetical protein